MKTQRQETYTAWNGAEMPNTGKLKIPYDLMDMVGDYCLVSESEAQPATIITMNTMYGKKYDRRYSITTQKGSDGKVSYKVTCDALKFEKPPAPPKPVPPPKLSSSPDKRARLTTYRDGVEETTICAKHPYELMQVGDHFLVEGVDRDAQSYIAYDAYDESKRLGAIFTVIRTDSTIKITRKS